MIEALPEEFDLDENQRTSGGNGLAVAALTLGIFGILFGLIPILFFLAWILGLLALIFGLIGRKQPVRRKMATWGALLGAGSLVLGTIGVVIVDRAVDDFVEGIEEIFEE